MSHAAVKQDTRHPKTQNILPPGTQDRRGQEAQFVERNAHEHGFASFFQDHILPVLRELENKRKKANLKHRFRRFFSLFCGILCLAMAAVGWLNPFELPYVTAQIMMWSSPVLLAVLLWWSNGIKRQFQPERKQYLAPLILHFSAPKQIYDANGKLDYASVTDTGLLGDFTRYEGSDRVTGACQGIGYDYCEAQLYQKRQLSFQGMLIRLQLPYEINGKILIQSEKLDPPAGWVGLERGQLEEIRYFDAAISGTYKVYANDEFESRRLITSNLAKIISLIAELRQATETTMILEKQEAILYYQTPQRLFIPQNFSFWVRADDDIRQFLALNHVVRLLSQEFALEATQHFEIP